MQGLQQNANPSSGNSCLPVRPERPVADLIEDVREGLLQAPRSLPPKYFYDGRGSQLFDQICNTSEYYPTRTEDALLRAHAGNIIALSTPDLIIELGSGTSKKTRRLFDACEQQQHYCPYAPFDVCEPMLLQAAEELSNDYAWLEVNPLLGDYHAGLAHLPVDQGSNLFVFLGSTIGNFTDGELAVFINDLRQRMSPGDYFLLGADRLKDNAVLNAAYNDAEGLTAAFNLNLLRVLNAEIGSDFALDKFRHHAEFNVAEGQIEMYLIALETQKVTFAKLQSTITLDKGERILTEISRKFKAENIEKLLLENGLHTLRHYQPDNGYFSLLLARAE